MVRQENMLMDPFLILLGLLLAVALVVALLPRRRRPSAVIEELDRKAQQPYVPPLPPAPTCLYSADVHPISGPLIRR